MCPCSCPQPYQSCNLVASDSLAGKQALSCAQKLVQPKQNGMAAGRAAALYACNAMPQWAHVMSGLLQLRIEGEGLRHVELSLEDLKTKFKRHSVAAAMQCSGNRRHDMIEVKKIQGLDWDVGRHMLKLCYICTCVRLSRPHNDCCVLHG